jgi:hypothetical protein
MNYGELKTAIQDYCQNSETSFVAHIPDFVRGTEDKIFMAVEMPDFWRVDKNQNCIQGTSEYLLDVGALDVLSVRLSKSTVLQSSGVEFGPVEYLLRKDYDFLIEANPGSTTVTSATITGISRATQAVVTATNTFSDGDIILIDDVSGMTQVNGNYYEVSDQNSSSFKIKSAGDYVDSRESKGFSLYISGGVASSGLSVGQPKYYAISTAAGGANNPTITIRLGPIPDAAYPFSVTYYGKVTTDSITNGDSDANTTWLSVTAPIVLLHGSLVEAYTYMKGEPDLVQNYQSLFQEGIGLIKRMGEGRQNDDGYTDGAKRVPTQ